MVKTDIENALNKNTSSANAKEVTTISTKMRYRFRDQTPAAPFHS